MKYKNTIYQLLFAFFLIAGLSSCGNFQQILTDSENNLRQIYSFPNGKTAIDINMLDGKWKITGLYKGDYTIYNKAIRSGKQTENIYTNACLNNDDNLFIFDVSKNTYRRMNCGIVLPLATWTINNEKEKVILTTSSGESFSIVSLHANKLILEGNFVFDIRELVIGVYVLEKVKEN